MSRALDLPCPRETVVNLYPRSTETSYSRTSYAVHLIAWQIWPAINPTCHDSTSGRNQFKLINTMIDKCSLVSHNQLVGCDTSLGNAYTLQLVGYDNGPGNAYTQQLVGCDNGPGNSN